MLACAASTAGCAAPGLAARAVALGALVLLHVAAERWSLSRLIEQTPVLRALDRLTGRRDEGL